MRGLRERFTPCPVCERRHILRLPDDCEALLDYANTDEGEDLIVSMVAEMAMLTGKPVYLTIGDPPADADTKEGDTMTTSEKLYDPENRDIESPELRGHYARHVSALTSEDLRAKWAIAAELAWRDAEIERLKAVILQPKELEAMALVVRAAESWRDQRHTMYPANLEGSSLSAQHTARCERDLEEAVEALRTALG